MTVQKYDIRRPEPEGGGFEERFWSPANSPVFGEDGELTYIIHRVEDVTEFVRLKEAGAHQEELTRELRVRAEEMEAEIFLRTQQVAESSRQLKETNLQLERANQAKDRFLASMSHELRTPLNAILGFAGTMLMELPGRLNRDQRKQLGLVQSNGRHLLSIINDLLDLAKIESGKLELSREKIDCRTLLEEVIPGLFPLAEQKGLALELELPSEQLEVRSDPRALSQILINLTNNAIKFTDEGEVRLSVSHEQRNGSPVTRFEVIDTGPGIDPADHERLFAAFEQGKGAGAAWVEGTGLGLYISRRLAALIGGEIQLESSPAEGSTFTLELRE